MKTTSLITSLVTVFCALVLHARQPNIVILMADDLGYADLGFQGSTTIPTPHLDALRKRGVRFTDGHVTASVCSPSRAGLIMGRYQQRFGHHANIPPQNSGMDPDETTIGEALKAQGYATGFIGKWHLGHSEDRYPTQQGFDTFIGLRDGHRDYWYKAQGHDKPGSHKAIEHNGKQIPFEGYVTDRFGDWSVDFVNAHHENPFFLFVSFTAPHGPLQAKDEHIKQLGLKSPYGAMIYSMDENIGKIVAALEKHQLTEDSMVWFLSDNGGITAAASNAPFTGRKGSAFEGGQRVPFILTWPGVTAPNTDESRLMSALDIFHTSLAAAGGIPNKNPRPLDGVDLKPFLTGKAKGSIHKGLFWQRENIAGYRQGKWKLIQVEEQGYGLFKLSEDTLTENNNLAATHPERARTMAATLQQWISQMPEPNWREGKVWLERRATMHSKEYTPHTLD